MKRTVCFVLVVLFSPFIAYTQSIEGLQASLDSLVDLKKQYQNRISDIDNEYSRVAKILQEKSFEQKIGDTYVCTRSTNIVESPDKYAIITPLPINSKVKVLEQTDKYSKIAYGEYIGWVLKVALTPEETYLAAEQKKKEKMMEQRKEQLQKEAEIAEARIRSILQREADLIKKYGKTDGQRIIDRKIWLGMTDDMALESWGLPDKNNRSVGSWGVHEQWVYERKDTYLYFENGILKSWQD